MELQAVIEAMKLVLYENIEKFRKIVIVTDSSYVVDNGKFATYHRPQNGWKTKD